MALTFFWNNAKYVSAFSRPYYLLFRLKIEGACKIYNPSPPRGLEVPFTSDIKIDGREKRYVKEIDQTYFQNIIWVLY